MNPAAVIILIIVAGILTERGIDAWEKVQVAKHEHREL